MAPLNLLKILKALFQDNYAKLKTCSISSKNLYLNKIFNLILSTNLKEIFLLKRCYQALFILQFYNQLMHLSVKNKFKIPHKILLF